MNFVIFGLTVSSSWGNGHAVLWRGLIAALTRAGHRVVFFERDVSYYAQNRDLFELGNGGELVLYAAWSDVVTRARSALEEADVAIVTSYCPDARAATALMLESRVGVRCFYDLDTPVTLSRLEAGETVDYLPTAGLGCFDLVLSYTGGGALAALRDRLGARRVVPLYGWVDAETYRPTAPKTQYQARLSYIGTYAADRQEALRNLFVEVSRAHAAERFVIAGAQYPADFPWTENIWFVRHLPPLEHPAFYAASSWTLNVTRRAMADMGWCPSGRLFEAAACGAAIVSDWWIGIDDFFTPGEEIVIARDTGDVSAALAMSPGERDRIAQRARARVIDEHTAARRVTQLIASIEQAHAGAEA